MATPTTNFAISKPAGTDLVDETAHISDGYDIIDRQLARFGFKGTDIASAAALTLPAQGSVFDVTGTTTVTSISTRPAGEVVILQFDGALTLTHNATTLAMAGATNAITVAGDVYVFVSEGSGNWREVCRKSTTLSSVMTANGDLVYRSAGVPTRLAIGVPNGQVLRTISGAPIWSAGADYNAVQSNAAAQRYSVWHWAADAGVQVFSATTPVFTAGGGGTVPVVGVATTTNRHVINVTHATLTVGIGSNLNFKGSAVDVAVAENPWYKVICAASNDGDGTGGTFEHTAGIHSALTTGQKDGVYFRSVSTSGTPGNWFLVCRSTSETTVDMGVLPTTTPILLEFRVSGDGTSVQGYLNGTSTGAAITTNIPTGALIVGYRYDVRTSTITTAATHQVYGMGYEVDLVA